MLESTFAMERFRHPDPGPLPPAESVAGIQKGSVTFVAPLPDDPPAAPPQEPRPEGCRTVYVGLVPEDCTDTNIHDAFSSCGKIEDIRLNAKKRFCHVQFFREAAIGKAIAYNGYWFRVGPGQSPLTVSRIVMNYAHSRDKEYLPFTEQNMRLISQQLKDKKLFDRASFQVKKWVASGHCTPETSAGFFALLSAIGARVKQVAETAESYEQNMYEMIKEVHEGTAETCDVYAEILEAIVNSPLSWEAFGKPQQNSLLQSLDWLRDFLTRLDQRSHFVLERISDFSSEKEEPSAKKAKISDGAEVLRSEIRQLRRDMDTVKTKHTVEMKEKMDQINQLMGLTTRFRENFPSEWKQVTENEVANVGQSVITSTVDLPFQALKPKQTANTMTLTNDEIAVTSILTVFLAIHPLGASLGEIAEYASNFGSKIDYVYIEKLMKKLPTVFKMTKSQGSEETKWLFLGFQTVRSSFDLDRASKN